MRRTSRGFDLLTKHLYLIGYRGTGKTTVAKLIARELDTATIDLDDVIEREAGKTIRAIFAKGGEASFRDWESRCLLRFAHESKMPMVASLGGGAILRVENREVIERGHCVWLTATAETIASRIQTDSTTEERRPALTELSPADEIRTVLTSREPLYRETCDIEVSTENKTPESVADEIVRWISTRK